MKQLLVAQEQNRPKLQEDLTLIYYIFKKTSPMYFFNFVNFFNDYFIEIIKSRLSMNTVSRRKARNVNLDHLRKARQIILDLRLRNYKLTSESISADEREIWSRLPGICSKPIKFPFRMT